MKSEKLIIAGRRNWKDEVYIKFKVEENCMKIIEKIVNDIDKDGYFNENFKEDYPKLEDYSKWKDTLIDVKNEKEGVEAKIICGDKYLHMFVKCPNYEFINSILDKHGEFASIERFLTKKKKEKK